MASSFSMISVSAVSTVGRANRSTRSVSASDKAPENALNISFSLVYKERSYRETTPASRRVFLAPPFLAFLPKISKMARQGLITSCQRTNYYSRTFQSCQSFFEKQKREFLHSLSLLVINYSKVIATISGRLPVRNGGPQVPAPTEVYSVKSPS